MAKKEDYQEKTEAQLNELEAQIEILRAKAHQATAEAKPECYARLAVLDTKREVARVRLQTMAVVGEEAWENLKGSVEHALSDLESALNIAAPRFE